MSRSFFQDFIAPPHTRSYFIRTNCIYHVDIAEHIPKETIAVITAEGYRLYPEMSSHDTEPDRSDDNVFYDTAVSDSLEEATRYILLHGRYAPYNKKSRMECDWVHEAMAKHPEIVSMLDANGYTMTESIFNSM